jgi:hypothetical protein
MVGVMVIVGVGVGVATAVALNTFLATFSTFILNCEPLLEIVTDGVGVGLGFATDTDIVGVTDGVIEIVGVTDGVNVAVMVGPIND